MCKSEKFWSKLWWETIRKSEPWIPTRYHKPTFALLWAPWTCYRWITIGNTHQYNFTSKSPISKSSSKISRWRVTTSGILTAWRRGRETQKLVISLNWDYLQPYQANEKRHRTYQWVQQKKTYRDREFWGWRKAIVAVQVIDRFLNQRDIWVTNDDAARA